MESLDFTMNKIIYPNENDRIAIGLCHGCWDPLHPGHVKHLVEAKSLVDILIVGVTADEFVGKGPLRPLIGEDDRAIAVAALACVDFVIVNHAVGAEGLIERFEPLFYFKGGDYRPSQTPGLQDELEVLEKMGGVFVTTESEVTHSSDLISRWGDSNDGS